MSQRWHISRLLVAGCVVALAANLILPRISAATGVTPSGTVTLSGQTPTVVLTGQAVLLGRHPAASPVTINVSLPLQNQPALAGFIANLASRGVYLTQQQFDATYGASPAQVQAVIQWASSHGLQPIFTSGDNTLISLRGSTAAVEGALQVTINDYRRADGAVFYSNDRDATVPAALGITAISGLNSIPRWHVLHQPAMRALFRSGGYFPSDFRTAYDVAGHGYDGTGQTIGFTLWGTSVPNSDLSTFASNTGDVAMSAGTGADQIEWIPENGGSTATDALVETALDVESAHGIATHAHLKYWLGDETCSGGQCGGSDTGLEDAISAAANDTSLHVVSNSWGGGEAPSTSDPFTSATTSSFQHAVAVGTTFYFSSGDSGSNSGGSGLASYPADSPYVISVGGTTLNTASNFTYSSESAWNGSGGGCSTVFARPSWQTGVGAATCSGRAEPDVSADADPNSGAYVYVQGSGQQVGGTSLAAPLFAGMATVADSYAAQTGLTRIGWAAPKIYSLANGSSYSTTFHDVTTGNNGYPAGPGWDEATGWGSIDWWNWVRAIVGTAGGGTATPTNTPMPAATATNTPQPGSSATNTPVPTATNTPTGACASDGTCLTGLTASATSVPVNTNVTLTATTNSDVGPTQWYIDIVDQTGAVVYDCPSGSSCVATVSASTATSRTYTAWLSTSPSGLSGGGPQSNSVTVSWTSSATATNTPVGPTKTPISTATNTPHPTATNTPPAGATATNTPQFTATNTPRPTATNTPQLTATNTPQLTATSTPRPTATNTPAAGGCSGSAVVNGGFETGTLSGWCTAGVGQGGQAVASTQHAHSGSYSARMGVPSGSSEPNGDNCMYQNINVSGTHTLSFYDFETDIYGDTITYDWQEAYWRPYGTTGCSETGTRLYKLEGDYEYWYHDSFSVTGPGQLYFNVHEDGSNDPSSMYIDDITLQ